MIHLEQQCAAPADRGHMQFSFRYQRSRKDAVSLRGGAVAHQPLALAADSAGTCASQLCFSLILKWRRRRRSETKERHMITKQLVLAGCTAVVLSVATAHAGPCNTGGKTAQDAGAGPTPGHTGQTIGNTGSATAEHPPTSTMNRATGDVPASSQDAQKQMQGQPTAAQQGQGAEPSAKMADQDC